MQRLNSINKILSTFHYDLFVIGGGSGGLATSKAAAKLNQKVGLADFITPSPQGTTWGLGGTCVNVGCIPKKLLHYAAQWGEFRIDMFNAGWTDINSNSKHDWRTMVQNSQTYIKRMNILHRQLLEQAGVTYFNKRAQLKDKNTIILTDQNGDQEVITAKNILIAAGSRPTLPENISDIGRKVITSDDLFSLQQSPGKTLVVGASYVALECAGFLHGLELDVTVMVRSILLRNFDQEMAEKVGSYMKEQGIKFIQGFSPEQIEILPNGKRIVKWGRNKEEQFDTILYAIGRTAQIQGLNLEQVGVKINPRNQKIICNEEDQTSVENIYAVGDCVDTRLELTPTAIMCGRRLARRLYQEANEKMNYNCVPTTVFTPLEYSCVGLSEQSALQKFGKKNIRVYVSSFKPLMWNFNSSRNPKACFAKLIVHIPTDKVLGIHYLGPDAAEVIQGFAVAMKLGVTKKQLDDTVAVHPSAAEEIVLMTTFR